MHGALFGEDVCKPGWSYFSGVCYSTSQSCKNWTEAQKTCQRDNANLVAIKTQEANVYVQHRLNGDKGWIGLNDRDTEGTFVWAGNQSSNFTYWAPHQPNDFRLNEDCVHTLGVRHSFKWNDVSCGTCHNFTCAEGKGIVISQVHISQILYQLRIITCSRKFRIACFFSKIVYEMLKKKGFGKLTKRQSKTSLIPLHFSLFLPSLLPPFVPPSLPPSPLFHLSPPPIQFSVLGLFFNLFVGKLLFFPYRYQPFFLKTLMNV